MTPGEQGWWTPWFRSCSAHLCASPPRAPRRQPHHGSGDKPQDGRPRTQNREPGRKADLPPFIGTSRDTAASIQQSTRSAPIRAPRTRADCGLPASAKIDASAATKRDEDRKKATRTGTVRARLWPARRGPMHRTPASSEARHARQFRSAAPHKAGHRKPARKPPTHRTRTELEKRVTGPRSGKRHRPAISPRPYVLRRWTQRNEKPC